MVPMTLAEVAAAVGGTASAGDGQVRVSAPATTDSRAVPAGGLYVARTGERADGHAFAAAALDAGAAACLVQRPVTGPHVLVDDTVVALGRLSRAVVDRLQAGGLQVVGITGSSGKTGTKDLLATLLETLGPTVAPENSHNNEVSMPLTALRADPSTRHLVLEMGARGVGHIAYLCRTARPRIGVVLNVGLAHAGEFGSKAATARAKSELVAALPPAADGGVAVLNADDELVAAMARATAARVVRYGLAADADVRAEQVSLDALGRPSFVLHAPGHRPAAVTLALHGPHQVSNALAAAAVTLELGGTLDQVAAALAAATPRSRWRMEVAHRSDGVTVVNDAYNANPDSTAAAIAALAAMGTGRRTWAVLGEMLELGAASAAEHERIGRLARRSGIDRVVAVGEGARAVHEAAVAEGASVGEGSRFATDVGAALSLLRAEVRPGDVVLVKASRGSGLEAVAAGLLAGDGAGEVVAP